MNIIFVKRFMVGLVILSMNSLSALGRKDRFVNMTDYPVEVVAYYPSVISHLCENENFVLERQGHERAIKVVNAGLCELKRVKAIINDGQHNEVNGHAAHEVQVDIPPYLHSLIVEIHKAPEGTYFLRVLRRDMTPLDLPAQADNQDVQGDAPAADVEAPVVEADTLVVQEHVQD